MSLQKIDASVLTTTVVVTTTVGMQRNTTPTNLPAMWRSVADEWERGAEFADSYQDHMVDRAIARTYRRLADELEQALAESQRRAS